MAVSDGRNIGLEVADRLVAVHGFEQAPEFPSQFRRIVDSQHAAIVTFGRWDEPLGGSETAVLNFGAARRDINELWRDLVNKDIPAWRATIFEPPPSFFKGRRSSFLAWDWTPEAMSEQVDMWIPRLVDEATSLSFIRAHLAETHRLTPERRDLSKIPRMIDTLLEGNWSDETEEVFFRDWRETLDMRPVDHPAHQKALQALWSVAAWVQEHPDGVNRELVD